MFPSYRGSGVFSVLAKLNHSCEPNASIEFMDSNQAWLLAYRDIKAGEELFISYVDDELDYDDRQFDLRTYGFQCKCTKCERELTV